MRARPADEIDGSISEQTGNLLRARLAGPLPADAGQAEALPALLGQLRECLFPMGGKPMQDIFLDPEPDLDVLEAIKRQAKHVADAEKAPPDHDVHITLYYAAIASALLFRDVKISTFSYADLAKSFERLCQQDWMPDRMRRHFRAAQKRCAELGKTEK